MVLYFTPQKQVQPSPLEKAIPNAVALFGKYYAESSLARDEYKHAMSLKGFGLLSADEEEITVDIQKKIDEGKAVKDAYNNVWSLPFKKEAAGPKKDYRLFVREDKDEKKHYQHFEKDEDVTPGKGWAPYEKPIKEAAEKKKNYELFEKKTDLAAGQKYFEKGEDIGPGWTKVMGKGVTATASATMTPTSKRELEKGIIKPTSTIVQYQDMLKSYDKNFFTYYGKGVAWTHDIGARLGIGKAKWSSRQRTFIQDVEQAFNKYRKDITGAQASMQEIRFLKSTIPSADDSGPVFEAKTKRFILGMARMRKRNAQFLQQGIPLPDKDDETSSIPLHTIDLTDDEVIALGLDPNDPIVMEGFGKKPFKKGVTGELKETKNFSNLW